MMHIQLPRFVAACLLVLTLPVLVLAQDQHFSQFNASPLTLNPALTGALEGKYRVSLIYRDQWRNALDNPYQTFSAAADFRYRSKINQKRYRDAFGVGMLFYNDKVNQVNYSNNQLNVSGAFHKALNPQSDQFLSLGAQIGIVQRSLNYSQLTFDDQFDGQSIFSEATAEEFPENIFAFSDIHVGLNYSYAPRGKTAFFAGAALHHILQPELSWYYRSQPDGEQDIRLSNTLYRKYSAYVNAHFPVSEAIQLQPRVLAYAQGPHITANAGMNIRLLANSISGTAIHFGGWARPVRMEDKSVNLDAIVAMLGLEHRNFLLGLSYDITGANASNFRSRNAFEISISYLGEYEDDTVLCPKF